MPGGSPHVRNLTPVFLSLGRVAWLRTWADKLVTDKEFDILSSSQSAGKNLMERGMGDVV